MIKNGEHFRKEIFREMNREINRGEIWIVQLDPTKGAEMQKTRPAIVISSNSIGVLPLKIVVPIIGWKDSFTNSQWIIKVEPSTTNGLSKISAIDTLQIRCIDCQRLVRKQGIIANEILEEIGASLAAIIEYQ
jgi:mRNA interferase MazF